MGGSHTWGLRSSAEGGGQVQKEKEGARRHLEKKSRSDNSIVVCTCIRMHMSYCCGCISYILVDTRRVYRQGVYQ